MANTISKETYDAPTLVAHGTIEEITQANTGNPFLDQDQMAGQAPLTS